MPENNFLEIIAKNRNLSIGAKGLYFYILNILNVETPNRRKIAYDLNISDATLGKHLKELRNFGYLKCKQRKTNGRFSINIYEIQRDGEIYAHANIQ